MRRVLVPPGRVRESGLGGLLHLMQGEIVDALEAIHHVWWMVKVASLLL
jgi:hypothetical protein